MRTDAEFPQHHARHSPSPACQSRRIAAVVDAGLDFVIARNATLGVAYSGQFGDRAADQSVKGNLAIGF
jgi:uncharacterized protein with beta-barrel porin domain